MIAKLFYFFSINSLLLIIFLGNSLSLVSQEVGQWSPPQNIPGYEDDTGPPLLIADQNRTVHAFASQWIGTNRKAIFYNQWTMDGGWTEPVDILLSPLKEARLLDAFLDQTGTMHVLFYGGDNTQANVYYSKAPAINAGSATAWSSPVLVGKEALDPESGSLWGDDNGNLIVLFSGTQNGAGLYAIYSNNDGESWSEPDPIYSTNNYQLFPHDLKMYLGQSGILHAVWSVYDNSGNGVAVYYANYDMDRKQWNHPLELGTAASGLSDVIEYDGRPLVVYVDYGTNAFWMRESSNNGQTWTNPTRIAPRHIGRNGVVSLGIDANKVLHFFFSERIPGKPDIHGVWHTTRRGSGPWAEVEAITSGPQVVDQEGDKSFDPYNVKAAVSQGNVLLVTWQTDPGVKGNGVWYSSMKLNAPELPVEAIQNNVPLSTPSISQTLFVPTSTPISTPETLPAVSVDMQSPSQIDPPGQNTLMSQIAVGILPVVFLILVAFLFRMYNHSRS